MDEDEGRTAKGGEGGGGCHLLVNDLIPARDGEYQWTELNDARR